MYKAVARVSNCSYKLCILLVEGSAPGDIRIMKDYYVYILSNNAGTLI